MSNYLQVITTTDDREKAAEIARTAVEKRLAACVQLLGPIQSTYWWKDKIESAQEWLLIMKTKTSLYQELEAAIKKAHNYTVPEILATEVVAGNPDYLAWMDHELGHREKGIG